MDDDFERHLDSDTLRFVRRKARQLAGRYGFQRHEVEDIQQSLILDLLQRLARFNSRRGVRTNFTRFIIKHGVSTLIEARRSSTRGGDVDHVSLDSPINYDSDASEFIDVIADHDYPAWVGHFLNRTEQRLIAKLDVERAIAGLPPDLGQICQLLVALDRIGQVTAVAGISRATLHRRMRVIRAAFYPGATFRPLDGGVMTAKAIAAALHGRRCGSGWTARCPAHKDRGPSLSICEKNGRVLVHCFAGCSQRAVIDALRSLGLWPEQERRVSTPTERRAWIRERRRIERQLPAALLWRRVAVILGEHVLDGLKSALWDSSLPQPHVGEIAWWTSLLVRWQSLDGFGLVEEYQSWRRGDLRLTRAMIRAGRNLELTELRALLRHVNPVSEEAA